MSADMIPDGFLEPERKGAGKSANNKAGPESVAETQRRASVKRRLRAGLVVLVLIGGSVAVLAMNSIFGVVARSQETEDIFTDASELPPELIDEITWLTDPGDLPREMEPLTRVDLTSSFLRAWEQLTIVSKTGDTSGVETYFAGPARAGVLARAGQWNDRSVKQLGHTLELSFYSEDGQVIGMTAVESRLLREQQTDAGVLSQESLERYDVVLVLDDGNWRIHHLIRRDYEPGSWTLAAS